MRIELAEHGLLDDDTEFFLVKIYSGTNEDIVETIEARLISCADENCSTAENQADSLRHAAARLVELAGQLHPAG